MFVGLCQKELTTQVRNETVQLPRGHKMYSSGFNGVGRAMLSKTKGQQWSRQTERHTTKRLEWARHEVTNKLLIKHKIASPNADKKNADEWLQNL